jgi:hypothetical protein
MQLHQFLVVMVVQVLAQASQASEFSMRVVVEVRLILEKFLVLAQAGVVVMVAIMLPAQPQELQTLAVEVVVLARLLVLVVLAALAS